MFLHTALRCHHYIVLCHMDMCLVILLLVGVCKFPAKDNSRSICCECYYSGATHMCIMCVCRVVESQVCACYSSGCVSGQKVKMRWIVFPQCTCTEL